MDISDNTLRSFFSSIKDKLPERYQRLVAVSMAEAIGHGGIKFVAEISSSSRSTIIRGMRQRDELADASRQRRPGGGRKKAVDAQQGADEALEALISPYTRGNPENPLRWTTKSLRKLEGEMAGRGRPKVKNKKEK